MKSAFTAFGNKLLSLSILFTEIQLKHLQRVYSWLS